VVPRSALRGYGATRSSASCWCATLRSRIGPAYWAHGLLPLAFFPFLPFRPGRYRRLPARASAGFQPTCWNFWKAGGTGRPSPFFSRPCASFALIKHVGSLGHDLNTGRNRGVVSPSAAASVRPMARLAGDAAYARLPELRPLYSTIGRSARCHLYSCPAHTPVSSPLAFAGENMFASLPCRSRRALFFDTIGPRVNNRWPTRNSQLLDAALRFSAPPTCRE